MKVPCRRVSEGTATGKVALSTTALSFLGEIDPATGKVDNSASELHGQTVTDRVLTFPQARGSTVGPYVIYGAGKRGVGPKAMVVQEADAIVASAAVIARLPCVDGIDIDLFRQGEEVTVNATEAFVEFPHVKASPVVTSFLQDDKGRVLLLKRSKKVGSFQERWAGVSGYLEGKPPREQALREIREETGLAESEVKLVREAPPIYTRHENEIFVVHPFLFKVRDPKVKLDWEHTEFEWVDPAEIGKRPTVPKLDKVWGALSAPVTASATAPGA